MRISAKVDYAVRAAVELASGGPGPLKGERIAHAQDIPLKFLENILGELRHAGIVRSQRGMEGGYWLARPAGEVSIADIIRAVEGPLATVRGEPPESLSYSGAAEPLSKLWIAVRANLREVL
jgi:Rrf2 family protein